MDYQNTFFYTGVFFLHKLFHPGIYQGWLISRISGNGESNEPMISIDSEYIN